MIKKKKSKQNAVTIDMSLKNIGRFRDNVDDFLTPYVSNERYVWAECSRQFSSIHVYFNSCPKQRQLSSLLPEPTTSWHMARWGKARQFLSSFYHAARNYTKSSRIANLPTAFHKQSYYPRHLTLVTVTDIFYRKLHRRRNTPYSVNYTENIVKCTVVERLTLPSYFL